MVSSGICRKCKAPCLLGRKCPHYDKLTEEPKRKGVKRVAD